MSAIAGQPGQLLGGLVSEAAVGLAADISAEAIAAAFDRAELLFADWIQRLPFGEARFKLDAWAATEHQVAVTEQQADEFEPRHFSVVELDRGMSTIRGALDNEGTAVVRAALSMLAAAGGDDDRSRTQRHADALVMIARFAVSAFEQRGSRVSLAAGCAAGGDAGQGTS